MTDIDTWSKYIRKSTQLKQEQAALELVNHIRRCIDQEYMQRTYKGDITDNLYVRLRTESYPFVMPTLKSILRGKTLNEQREIVEYLLEPHRMMGHLPPYRVHEEQTTRGYAQHIRVDYDFAM